MALFLPTERRKKSQSANTTCVPPVSLFILIVYTVYLSIHPSIHLSTHPSTHPSFHPTGQLPGYLPTHPSPLPSLFPPTLVVLDNRGHAASGGSRRLARRYSALGSASRCPHGQGPSGARRGASQGIGVHHVRYLVYIKSRFASDRSDPVPDLDHCLDLSEKLGTCCTHGLVPSVYVRDFNSKILH